MVYSVYDDVINKGFDNRFLDIAAINDLERDDLLPYLVNDEINLDSGAINYSDGTISGNETTDSFVIKQGEIENKPLSLSGKILMKPQGVILIFTDHY